MREIGAPNIGSHIMNSHIKRPRSTINQRIGSRKKAIFQSHLREIADKKTAYNEGRLYLQFSSDAPHSLLIIQICIHVIINFSVYLSSIYVHNNTWSQVIKYFKSNQSVQPHPVFQRTQVEKHCGKGISHTCCSMSISFFP